MHREIVCAANALNDLTLNNQLNQINFYNFSASTTTAVAAAADFDWTDAEYRLMVTAGCCRFSRRRLPVWTVRHLYWLISSWIDRIYRCSVAKLIVCIFLFHHAQNMICLLFDCRECAEVVLLAQPIRDTTNICINYAINIKPSPSTQYKLMSSLSIQTRYDFHENVCVCVCERHICSER